MIYVHAYPFKVDDPERNVRSITALARDKKLATNDVLIFPFQALSGTAQDYWSTRIENRERNAHWLTRLAESLKRTSVRLILPAVLPEGLGVFSLSNGSVESLDFEWITGGVAVKSAVSHLDYDLNFRSAAVGEPFEPTQSADLLVIDGQGFSDSKVWLGQCKVVRHGRTRANYMAYDQAFSVDETQVSWLDVDHERFAAMQLALKLYMKRCGFEKVSLGLSGGLDIRLGPHPFR